MSEYTVRRVRATYVIAADEGSSPTLGQLGIEFEGTTYEDRWVVIDTKVLQPWLEVDRLWFTAIPSVRESAGTPLWGTTGGSSP